MEAFVADPGGAFTAAIDAANATSDGSASAIGEVLKSGNSATVIRSVIGSQTYVIKRYNVKGLWHGVRRALKPQSRFRLAWCNGHRLAFLRIPTARPVALVERRIGPLRGVAYLVMKDLGDRDLVTEVAENGLSDELLAEVTGLFCSLQVAELTHGDMKATNFLCSNGGVHLIDLDAMHEGSEGLAGDVQRFLANWDNQLGVRETFREAFAAAGLPSAG